LHCGKESILDSNVREVTVLKFLPVICDLIAVAISDIKEVLVGKECPHVKDKSKKVMNAHYCHQRSFEVNSSKAYCLPENNPTRCALIIVSFYLFRWGLDSGPIHLFIQVQNIL